MVIKKAKTFVTKFYSNNDASSISEAIRDLEEKEVNPFLKSLEENPSVLEADTEVKPISQDGSAVSSKGLHARVFIFYIVTYTIAVGNQDSGNL